MANPLKILTALQVSGALSTSGSLSVGGNGSLTVANGATITANGIKVTGSSEFLNALTASAVSSSGVSSFGTLNVGAGGLTVDGNLTVNGTLTKIDTENLFIEDKKVVIASGSTLASAVNGAGLFIGGVNNDGTDAISSITFVSSSDAEHELRSSHWLGAAADKGVKIGGAVAVKTLDLGMGGTGFAITSGSTGNYVGVTDSRVVMSGSQVDIKGATVSLGPSVLGGDAEVEIQSSNVYIRPNLQITGSGKTFTNLTNTSYDGGFVNVLEAIKELDTSIGGGITRSSYYGLRTAVQAPHDGQSDVSFLFSGSVGFGDNGTDHYYKAVTGLTASTAGDLINLLTSASFDVAVKAAGANSWTNDLVSVTVTASNISGPGTASANYWFPKVTISAPALTSGAAVRLILVNEASGAV